MNSFAGFPAGKTRFTPIPDLFYTELLQQIDDLAELQVTLFMFWFLNRQRGYPRYMTLAELKAEGVLLSALRRSQDNETVDPTAELARGVERAVGRGTLLKLGICGQAGQVDYLFLNTTQGRKAVGEVKRGELVLETRGPIHEAHIDQPRPNIFELYEQNIGLLQPLLAEDLQEAAQTYPDEWIVDAFKIAVERNVRNWRYIKAILERWSSKGRGDTPRPPA
jgi:DnaD/phage-associated family protein